ncbi:ABC transporter ATP-binding protein [Uliginosibacterium aquaticum]|uniref:ABC transporter ATP-binding protein n=1 Tax=Uliginosibacterium aquaticum TaxID=2731212 RepID=A0ABX2IEJ0_9RHOO|nr:ABC transporter ATP-binding protein [Uliginosibacterium aquaticum]NSL55064.1 ABC transporter ATP-binding protein [Uliginosibacterium aquaticum]
MIDIQRLVKKFDDFTALGPLGFTFDQERILTVIGPSGCGKSTLLRLLSGLEAPTQGRIRLDGETISGPNPLISVAFQEPRLMPWLTVAQNVELAVWDRPDAERKEAVQAALVKVSLTQFADALPKQLSGGMAQRVGLARALVGSPRLLLLDEPFSALDPLTRVRMQDHLLEIVGDDGPNVLLITHDIDEAIVLSDRIIVLDGPPAQIRRDLVVDLPKPRKRSSREFQEIKELLLADLLPERIGALEEAA